MAEPGWLTIKQFAAFTKERSDMPDLSEFKIRQLIREQRLPAWKLSPRKIYLAPDALEQMRRNEQGGQCA